MSNDADCDLELVCSPTCPINLDPETATQAGVPLAARYFFYCFGGFRCDERVKPTQLSLEAAKETGEWEVEAVAALVQCGGFVYLDEAGKVLQANIEADRDHPLMEHSHAASAKTIRFGQPFHFQRVPDGRWVKGKVDHTVRATGEVPNVAWLTTGENEFAPFGCFVFDFPSTGKRLAYPVLTS